MPRTRRRSCANSIHHSFNKCITVHMTSNLTFQDNVCARIVGHMFYEEHGSEEHVSFQHNLGLGAMSNSFDIYKVHHGGTGAESRSRAASSSATTGGRATTWRRATITTTASTSPTPTSSRTRRTAAANCPTATAGSGCRSNPIRRRHPGACKPGELYTEPASGFWITNPGTELIGNAIGGCQGVGRGVLVGDAARADHGERRKCRI